MVRTTGWLSATVVVVTGSGEDSLVVTGGGADSLEISVAVKASSAMAPVVKVVGV